MGPKDLIDKDSRLFGDYVMQNASPWTVWKLLTISKLNLLTGKLARF